MTFNVNFGIAGDSSTIAGMRESGADLVLLQETTESWERVIRKELADVYAYMDFRHCCGAGGLAILSKGALLENRYFEARSEKNGWFPAWSHVVQTPIGKVQALNVHLRPPLSESGSVLSGYFSTPSVREDEIEAFFAKLDEKLPTIIAGDFNEGSDGKAIQFLRKRGLRSALPEFQPSANTWRWQTSVGTVHSQLDHITYAPQLVPLNAAVIKTGRSDHWPVIATFRRVE